MGLKISHYRNYGRIAQLVYRVRASLDSLLNYMDPWYTGILFDFYFPHDRVKELLSVLFAHYSGNFSSRFILHSSESLN